MPEASAATTETAASQTSTAEASTPKTEMPATSAIERLSADIAKTSEKTAKTEAKPETPPKEDPKPENEGDEKATPKQEAKAEAKPQDTAKPPQKLYAAHETLKKRVATELEPKIAELTRELEAAKKASKANPESEKALEAANKEIERLSGELREAAFERSPDFQKRFVARGNALYKEAIQEVTSLTVTTHRKDPETGEDVTTERPATEQDFRAIYNLQPRDQDRALAALFGPSADRVRNYIHEMRRNERDAQQAISEAREGLATKSKEEAQRTAKEKEQYNAAFSGANQELETKWPEFFKLPDVDGEKADKELAELHQKGYELVDTYVSGADKMPLEDRAAYAAVVRARAAAFPRLVRQMQRLQEQLETLSAKQKAREASDPGSGEERGSGRDQKGTGKTVPGGISAAAEKFAIPA